VAEGTLIKPAFVARLTDALSNALPGAEIGDEVVRRDRYRFVVISSKFEEMGHPERQRIVWDLAERSLDPMDLLNVAMIITMAPSEVQGK
jgi:stress-induced morphogen